MQIVRFACLPMLIALPPLDGGLRADDEPDADQVKQDVETFETAYSLSEGEVLARLIPPFIPERLVYYRATNPGQAQAIPAGPDSMFFRWENNKLARTGMSFSNGQGIEVRGLLRMLADVFPQEVEGDQPILDTQISGDFVLRAGESREHVVESLEAILRDEPKLPVRLRFREVKRQVYVLRGEYKFTPLPGYPDSVQIYGDKLAPNSGAGGGGGEFSDFTRWVGMWIERPVIGEVENPPQNLSWRYHLSGPFTPEQRAAAKDPRSVLHNLEDQTGLKFEEETREIRLLFVERDG
jgi:hypothetical protein